MTADPIHVQLDQLCTAHRGELPAVFAGIGAGADIDAAFDDAAARAGNEHGFTGTHPSLAGADSATVAPVQDAPAVPEGAAVLHLAQVLADGQLADGIVHAWPLAVASAFTRRRVRVTLTDTALVPPTVGRLTAVPAALREAIAAELAEQGADISADELLESVDVVRVRARYKPVVEVFRGGSSSSFALLDPASNVLVQTGFATAGEARRSAVAAAKAGALTTAGADPQVGPLEVVKVTRRDGGLPLIRVGRTRLTSTVVVKVVLVRAKNPARTKVAGWLFAGTGSAPQIEQN